MTTSGKGSIVPGDILEPGSKRGMTKNLGRTQSAFLDLNLAETTQKSKKAPRMKDKKGSRNNAMAEQPSHKSKPHLSKKLS